jgi:cellulose biosynthesis protein BcsQ
MKKETLFVAFSTQKGGMGKTALTVLSASYLHYVRGYDVAVIDCDYPQHSIVEMRNRDVEQITNNPYYKRLAYIQFKTLQKKAYRIEESNAADAIEVAENLKQELDLDFIFFDLPGTLNTKGVVKTLAMMDYVFVPVSADRVVLESTLQFASTVHDNLITTGKSNIKDLFLIWNMVDGRERTELYTAYDNAIAELGLQVMQTIIPDTKRFRREMTETGRPVFRSTLLPVDKSLAKGSNIEELTDEICKIVKR